MIRVLPLEDYKTVVRVCTLSPIYNRVKMQLFINIETMIKPQILYKNTFNKIFLYICGLNQFLTNLNLKLNYILFVIETTE